MCSLGRCLVWARTLRCIARPLLRARRPCRSAPSPQPWPHSAPHAQSSPSGPTHILFSRLTVLWLRRGKLGRRASTMRAGERPVEAALKKPLWALCEGVKVGGVMSWASNGVLLKLLYNFFGGPDGDANLRAKQSFDHPRSPDIAIPIPHVLDLTFALRPATCIRYCRAVLRTLGNNPKGIRYVFKMPYTL
jgi:hypothetical protein